MPAKPSSIMIQVEVSGTEETCTLSRILPTFGFPPGKEVKTKFPAVFVEKVNDCEVKPASGASVIDVEKPPRLTRVVFGLGRSTP